jgi:ribosomal protein S18 acetylase RimI-like enzyme
MVRQATAADADAIARVHVRTWQEAYAHVFPAEELASISLERRAEYWRTVVAHSTTVLVAEVDGDVVGFASVGSSRDADSEGLGELFAIYVDPAHWDAGIGRELGVAADESLRKLGFDEATLWVLEDNPRARRFYEAGGWHLDGARRVGTHLGVETSEVRYRRDLSITAGV